MHQTLEKYFGFTRFLDGQEEVVGQILSGADLCVIMPTGAGKSLCYQLPILMRPGYGLVVSPLISLMKDQVDSLTERGMPAACVNSSIPPQEQDRILRDTAHASLGVPYQGAQAQRSGRAGAGSASVRAVRGIVGTVGRPAPTSVKQGRVRVRPYGPRYRRGDDQHA